MKALSVVSVRAKPWYEQAAAKATDIRDAEEHEAVAAALAELPDDHPARQAYAGAKISSALPRALRPKLR